MTSGKAARRQRQTVARPPTRSTEGRKASPLIITAAAGIVLLLVTVILIVVLAGGGSKSSSKITSGTKLPDASVIASQFHGIPQSGNVLGKATAPVTMIEYIDLQCPICRQFETEVFPTIVNRYVRTGKLKVEARPIAFIGPDSERGRRAMLVAEQHDKGFNFSQLLYFNQGAENSGWLDGSMIADAAVSVGVGAKTVADNLNTTAVADKEQVYDQQAKTDKVSGTPTVYVLKTGSSQKTEVTPGSAPSIAELSAAIDQQLKQ